jgi:hypothetical protein
MLKAGNIFKELSESCAAFECCITKSKVSTQNARNNEAWGYRARPKAGMMGWFSARGKQVVPEEQENAVVPR